MTPQMTQHVDSQPEAIVHEPYSMMGNQLGMSLSDFKARNRRPVVRLSSRGEAYVVDKRYRGGPFCSDDAHIEPLWVSSPLPSWHGFVYCRIDLDAKYTNPFYAGENSGTAAKPDWGPFQPKFGEWAPIDELYFHFIDGRLFQIDGHFHSGHFDTVKELFTEKYGLPSHVSRRDWQNRLGAVFEGEVVEWDNGASHIELRKYGDRINQSEFELVHKTLGKTAQDRVPKEKVNF